MASAIVQNVLARANEDEAENIRSIQVEKAVDLEYDLGNLLAYDINDIDVNILRSDKESFLKNLARDDVQLLINRIFELPTDRVENEIVVKLPPPTSRLPRAKPVPKAKQLTKWEKFAKEKGITTRKKSRVEWDEELQKWVPRFGFKKALADKEKNWAVELKENDKDDVDPRAKQQAKKQEAVAKNELQRLRNLSKRMKMSKSKTRINLEPTDKPTVEQLNRAVFIAHTATASVGKFQRNLAEQKPVLKSGQKRRFDPLVGDVKNETKRSLEILDKMRAKNPKLDIEKAVNREMNAPGSSAKPKGNEKKSKTQLKKEVGKKKHKPGKSIPGKRGKGGGDKGRGAAGGGRGAAGGGRGAGRGGRAAAGGGRGRRGGKR